MHKHESRYVKIAQQALHRYRHRHSPHTDTQPQVAACTLMMFYLKLSYRDGEEWLWASDQVCSALGLSQVPDHSTHCRMYHQLNRRRVLSLLRHLLVQRAPHESVIGLDSTGYSSSQASAYYLTRSGKRQRGWFHGAYAVGTETQLILSALETHGGGPNDARFLTTAQTQSTTLCASQLSVVGRSWFRLSSDR